MKSGIKSVLLFIQGLAEVARCILCLRLGHWPARLHDVEELETAILHEQEVIRQHDSASAEAKA